MNHRDDFTESDLPEGYRALAMNEQRQPGDEILFAKNAQSAMEWQEVAPMWEMIHVTSAHHKHRTRRAAPVVATCEKCGQPLPH